MRNCHGDFIWYELMTPDPSGAKAFYERVIGLSIPAEGQSLPGGTEYREIRAPDGTHAGGVLTLSPEMTGSGARPGWVGYIAVEDVDEAVAKARSAGASVSREPMTMEGVGRMAMLSDPQGAHFYVMRGEPDEESRAYQMMSHGHVAWNELTTSDFAAGRRFYYDLFNWTDGEAMDMGDMGPYQMFDQNGQSIGGMMQMTGDGAPPPSWLFYFAVPDIDVAHEAITSGGGQVLSPPQEIPGGHFCVTGIDPQGAMFAIVGPRGE